MAESVQSEQPSVRSENGRARNPQDASSPRSWGGDPQGILGSPAIQSEGGSNMKVELVHPNSDKSEKRQSESITVVTQDNSPNQ